MEELINEIELDDLDGESRQLAEVIGIDAFRRLVRNYSGTEQIYVPTMGTVTAIARNKRILKGYMSGVPVSQLAREWNLSGQWVKKIIKSTKTKAGQ